MNFESGVTQEVRSYRTKGDVIHKYKIGDLIYSLWKGQLWKAVILDISYKIHPNGWHPIYYIGYPNGQKGKKINKYRCNKSYNEWKSESLIFDVNDNTRKKSLEIQKTLNKVIKSDKLLFEELINKLSNQQEYITSILKYGHVEDLWFEYTDKIYSILLDDNKKITSGNVVILPKEPNVKQIFSEYIKHMDISKYNIGKSGRPKKRPINDGEYYLDKIIQEKVISILLKTFNNVLNKRLLYNIETYQLNYLNKYVKKEYSVIYGIEHLLRFFIKIPKIIGNVSFGNCNIITFSDNDSNDKNTDCVVIKSLKDDIVKTVNSIIKYIDNNISRLSINKYKQVNINVDEY